MHVPQLHPAPAGQGFASDGDVSLVGEVQSGLNLFLKLKTPAQMPALMATLQAVKPNIDNALRSLHYVHFARFVPTQDYSALMVITVFDGPSSGTGEDPAYIDSLKSYVMDFVAVIGDEFTAMLEFVKDAPRLPVKMYPRDFVDFVIANNMKINPWSAYPDLTVIDIQRARTIR